MKIALVVRYGAYGDMIMITPCLKKLKEMNYRVILNTGKRGEEVLRGSPLVDEFVMHDESLSIDNLNQHWEELKKKYSPDKYINFSESIECNVALHPVNSEYTYTKAERAVKCNKNYYEVTAKWAGLDGCQMFPELHFTEAEEAKAKSYIKEGKFNVVWGMSGSGRQKVYPWTEYVIGEVLRNHKDFHFITVGDLRSQLLETLEDENITHLSGEITFRDSMALTKFADLVVAPDTGILHAAGCYETPKIGLLGHTTRENITKHFKNDYSIEAKCGCAPCFHLIYDHEIQCPTDAITKAAWCMSMGIKPESVYATIERVYNERKNLR